MSFLDDTNYSLAIWTLPHSSSAITRLILRICAFLGRAFHGQFVYSGSTETTSRDFTSGILGPLINYGRLRTVAHPMSPHYSFISWNPGFRWATLRLTVCSLGLLVVSETRHNYRPHVRSPVISSGMCIPPPRKNILARTSVGNSAVKVRALRSFFRAAHCDRAICVTLAGFVHL